jgi:dTDP-glucose pyrophosphorylase
MTSPINADKNSFFEKWQYAVLTEHATIKDAIQKLDEVALQILLIIDNNKKLIGTLSDGDIRRGLLKGRNLQSSISPIVFRNPLVVPESLQRELVFKLMTINKIRQIPIVDESGEVVGLHLWDNLAQPKKRDNMMVIMAGGRGMRMHPHTEDCPKPMLRVAGKPMLEHIILQAKADGFINFAISINYLGHLIEDYFGDGHELGVHIQYLREKTPLGTAGSLSLIRDIVGGPFIITNGDVITNIRYSELLDFHISHNAIATMAVRLHEWQHPFGVVNMEGINISSIEEKPILLTHINAGVYVIDPIALSFLKAGQRYDMPSLFEHLQHKELRTVAYPMHEPWLDVGRPADLDLANLANN